MEDMDMADRKIRETIQSRDNVYIRECIIWRFEFL